MSSITFNGREVRGPVKRKLVALFVVVSLLAVFVGLPLFVAWLLSLWTGPWPMWYVICQIVWLLACVKRD